MKKATAEWLSKAEADWQGAKRLARGKSPLYDLVCFHCQQSPEKYLKALMEELGAGIHDDMHGCEWCHLRDQRLNCLTPCTWQRQSNTAAAFF
jgi:hypothetical protein